MSPYLDYSNKNALVLHLVLFPVTPQSEWTMVTIMITTEMMEEPKRDTETKIHCL